MYFRRGSIFESPGSMVEFGEFLITVDPVRLNTTKQDQQDPKNTFMGCHVHACAKRCLGFSSNCVTGADTRAGDCGLCSGPHRARVTTTRCGVILELPSDRNQQREGPSTCV